MLCVARKVFDAEEQERLRAVRLIHRLHDRPLEEWEEAARHLQTPAARPAQRLKMFRHPRALPPYDLAFEPDKARADDRLHSDRHPLLSSDFSTCKQILQVDLSQTHWASPAG